MSLSHVRPPRLRSPWQRRTLHVSGRVPAAVTSELAGLGYAVVGWEPDGVNVIAPDRDGEQYIGLSNLNRHTKAAEKPEWPQMIREFLGHVTGALAGPKIPDDLTTVANQLRPRLGKPFAREGKAYPWGLSLPGTGLEINIVIDFPNTMAYVTDDMLKKTAGPGKTCSTWRWQISRPTRPTTSSNRYRRKSTF